MTFDDYVSANVIKDSVFQGAMKLFHLKHEKVRIIINGIDLVDVKCVRINRRSVDPKEAEWEITGKPPYDLGVIKSILVLAGRYLISDEGPTQKDQYMIAADTFKLKYTLS